MKNLLTALLLVLGLSSLAQPKVYYVSFDNNTLKSSNPIKEFSQTNHKKEAKPTTMKLFPEVEYQTLQGIGGCFNEIGGVALMSLPEAEREKVMSNLFSDKGAAFAMCRTAIGSSDFGVDAYSYAEVANDYDMKKFSIEREMTSVIPYMKLALKYNPKMKLFGSPWSPPAWMKESKFMDRGVEFPDKNHLIDDPKIYSAYAKYFRKYVEAYAKQGIRVDRILIQNETDITTKYPSNIMRPEQMYDFVSKYLRPEFNKNKIKTEIWAGTFRTAKLNLHAIEFAANPDFVASVDGLGIQYTNERYIADMNSLIAGKKPIMHTESVCFRAQNSVGQAKSRFGEVASYINNGSENFAYWNMILNEEKKSGWNWPQNSLIVINRETKEVSYNPDYAVMSLMSKFIRPGAIRIAAFPSSGNIVTKYNGKKYIIVQNESAEVKTYTIAEGKDSKEVATAFVPANSLAVIEY